MSLILSRGCILFLTEEHRRTEHTKAHRDIKSTDITEPYSQQRPHPQPPSQRRKEGSPRYPYTISVCSAAYPRIIRMPNTLSLRLRLRSSYKPLVCHSVILSLPVHLLLCLSSPHPSHLSTCYSVLHHPTHPTCPPVTLSYITPLTPPVHLLLCLKPPHPLIYFILFLFCLYLPI